MYYGVVRPHVVKCCQASCTVVLLDLLNCGIVMPKGTVVLSGHMYCSVIRPPVLSFCQATGTVMLTEHLYFSVARPYFTLVMSGLPLL